MAEVGHANDAVNAFGVGHDADFGTENGVGGRNSLSTKEKLVTARQVGHSPKLRRIASDLLGRILATSLFLIDYSDPAYGQFTQWLLGISVGLNLAGSFVSKTSAISL